MSTATFQLDTGVIENHVFSDEMTIKVTEFLSQYLSYNRKASMKEPLTQ